jgi:predicted nucleic acid-binding protein
MIRPSFVIDASVIIAWYSPEEVSMYANSILDCLENGEAAITPQLCCLEVNNVMRVLKKRGTLSNLTAEKALASINSVPIRRDNVSLGFEIPLIRSFSCRYGLTIYDACYLELAVRLNLPLTTLDRELLEASNAVGIALKK